MQILILYDSFYGNTEKIALAINNSLSSDHSVKVSRVSEFNPGQLNDFELLIVGSPTQGFRPTKAMTEFLNKIPSNALKGIKVSAFDTRISVTDINSRFLKIFIRLFGYAAKPLSTMLVKRGGILVIPPIGFLVKDTEGPLKDGELDRATEWGKLVVKSL